MSAQFGEHRVRQLHVPTISRIHKGTEVCEECGTAYPCKTILVLGPDPLYPPLKLPPRTEIINGEEVEFFPGDPRMAIRVRSVYGPLVEQVVEAHSLREALEKAAEIDFKDWIGPEW